MPRVSREQAENNHRRVIEEAARLLREHGVDNISIPQVMSAAGLTHGGFYKQFASKDDLVALAGENAFARRLPELTASAAASGEDRDGERRSFLRRYLSTAHRDNPGVGCAAVALAADAARAESGHPLRGAYVEGLRRMTEGLDALEPGGRDTESEVRPGVLVDVATIVGAVVLARATAGDDLSERILDAVRERLLDGEDGGDRTDVEQ